MSRNQKNYLRFALGVFVSSVLLYTAAVFIVPTYVNAQISEPLVQQIACTETGNCGFCDIVYVFITIGKWLITGAAGLALVIIVNASVSIITSAGNAEKVGGAKKQIVGAILGMGITFMAFQLVGLVISLVAVPSNLQTYENVIGASGKGSEEFGKSASLSNFLGGVAWWNICNKDELVNTKEGTGPKNSTATCRYWGDGTKCKTTSGAEGKCCRYYCGIGECLPLNAQSPFIGDNDFIGQEDISQQFSDEYDIRNSYKAAGIMVGGNKPACPLGISYKKIPSGCTTLFGLPDDVLGVLVDLKGECDCPIVITGGTETGHGSHKPGEPIVDLDIPVDGTYNDALSIYITYSSPNTPRAPKGYCTLNGRRAYFYYVDGSTFMNEYNHWHVIAGKERPPCGDAKML